MTWKTSKITQIQIILSLKEVQPNQPFQAGQMKIKSYKNSIKILAEQQKTEYVVISFIWD